MHPKVLIGKINFSSISFDSLQKLFIKIIESPVKCYQVVVANVYSIYAANKDFSFYEICKQADIVLADGLPVIWASKILNCKLPERIAGPDFMWLFSQTCAERGYRMFLLGGRQEHLNDLIKNLHNAFPGIIISGAYSPPFGHWDEKENNKIISMINEPNTDVLWLGVSTPKQDKWIFEHKQQLKAKVAIGVGAAFDFHAGRVKRAPMWMQKNGLEWVYRLIQEPRRMWKRYLFSNALFIYIVVVEIIKKFVFKNHQGK